MSAPLPDHDEQLELKKRARRRLIGAVVFATIAAVILPMVMDSEPPPALPNIELRIPVQEKGFVPPAVKSAAPAVPSVQEPVMASAESPAVPASVPTAPAASEPDKLEKPVVVDSPSKVVRPPVKASPSTAEAIRAQAILQGQEPKAAKAVEHVILIGAFADPANVENLKRKIGELGIRVYTEPLESPQGKKTRVRAGPFPSRDAALRAAERIKTIGVKGVVSTRS